jgi:CheY-like chemotaxis protein
MATKKNNALILEDLEMHRSFIKTYLSLRNFDVDVAEDGLIGLERVKEKKYDIIFTDIQMPNMNGLEFLKNIKENPETREIPVIMLTTEDDPETIDRAKYLGAAFYMVKPYTNEKMKKALQLVGFDLGDYES